MASTLHITYWPTWWSSSHPKARMPDIPTYLLTHLVEQLPRAGAREDAREAGATLQ